jgi:chemotaxis protein CheX
MNVKFVNPFVDAALGVIEQETGYHMQRGDLGLEKSPFITNDITVVIALVGMVTGNVLYSLSFETATAMASRMLGEKLTEFDNLAQSGVAELGNVITGQASVKLSQAGYESTISPPTLVVGKGITISTLDRARLVVPFTTEAGPVVIHLALRENATSPVLSANIPVPSKPRL